MGILGPDTRTIAGELYICQAEMQDRGEAEMWKKEYQSYGFKCRIIPNAHKKCYQVFVSEHQTAGVGEQEK